MTSRDESLVVAQAKEIALSFHQARRVPSLQDQSSRGYQTSFFETSHEKQDFTIGSICFRAFKNPR
jgi:hypothetical protein